MSSFVKARRSRSTPRFPAPIIFGSDPATNHLPPNPAELLQSQAMTDVLERVRKMFDVIILDAPPLLPVTDAALLTAQSDGALVVARYGKTSKDQLAHAMDDGDLGVK